MKGFIYGLLFAILLLLPAHAQSPQKTYRLELTEQMLNVIAGALAKQPYGEVAPVINELQKQLAAQPAPEPAKPEEKDKK